MPFSRKQQTEFRKWGVEPFIAKHGKPEDIRNNLNTQQDRTHGGWIQRGSDIECTKCFPKHGFWKVPLEKDGKHYILDGDDENGHPKFALLDI